jgi:acyl-CoA dehydrogenase
MNLDFTPEQQELRGQARRLLEARKTLTVDRHVLEGRALHAEGLWKEAADLGWLGASIPESHGGLGLSRVYDCGMAEEFGRVLAPLPLESSFSASEALILAGSEEQKARWLPKMAEGRAIGTLALCEGPGPLLGRPWRSEVRRGRLSGTKVPVCDGQIADFAIVGASGDGGAGLWVVELGQGVRRERLSSIDPSRPLSKLIFEDAAAEPLAATGRDAGETLARIVERGAVYTAFLQLGGAQAALEKTRDWALQREAFGRPIGGFQAVKHRLADLFAKIEIARSNAYHAAWALATDAPELPLAAAAARVSATTAFEQAARDMIHLHGALGVTWESDCQLYYRRSRHLAVVLGAAQEWRERIMKAIETRAARGAA